MLDVERWAELRREHFVRGVSIKELVRRYRIDRGTVRRRCGLRRRRAMSVRFGRRSWTRLRMRSMSFCGGIRGCLGFVFLS